MKSKSIAVIFSVLGNLYINAQITTTLQPSDEGKDAEIGLIVPDNNYGNSEKLSPYAWTQQSVLNVVRPLIEFDLSSIPEDATIIDAKLSLYRDYYYTPMPQHHGDNAFWIRRITSPWEENTVTWNSQPMTTADNEIYVPASTSATQNYLNIDVTTLLLDIRNDPANSYGFMFQLQNETPYRNVILASSDNADRDLHPRLEITYTQEAKVTGYTDLKSRLTVYPNPFNHSTTIEVDTPLDDATLTVLNSLGQIVKKVENLNGQKIDLNREGLMNGSFFIRITQKDEVIAADKLMIID